MATRFQYTGREADYATGLYYNRARWYDPQLGRFISEDPLGFAGGDINLYGYVRNNPVYFTDPLGLSPPTGSGIADWLDGNIEYARQFYQRDEQHWIWNATIKTDASLLNGFTGTLRLGSGIGYALFDENASGWQRAGAVGEDVLRLAGIAGGVSRLLSSLARSGAPAAELGFCSMRANGVGVYSISTEPNYIGQSLDMGTRVASHFKPGGKLAGYASEG